MARRSRADEMSLAIGPIFLEICKFLQERGTPLALAEMKNLMERMERTAQEEAGKDGNNGFTT